MISCWKQARQLKFIIFDVMRIKPKIVFSYEFEFFIMSCENQRAPRSNRITQIFTNDINPPWLCFVYEGPSFLGLRSESRQDDRNRVLSWELQILHNGKISKQREQKHNHWHLQTQHQSSPPTGKQMPKTGNRTIWPRSCDLWRELTDHYLYHSLTQKTRLKKRDPAPIIFFAAAPVITNNCVTRTWPFSGLKETTVVAV